MLVEGSYVGMMQVDRDDTPAEAKLHTESFKLLLCYKVFGLGLGLGLGVHTWLSNPLPRFLLPVTSQVSQLPSLG